MPKVKDDLSDLCAIPSIPEPDHISDCDAAAGKVKDMMTDAGMGDVFIDNEDGGPPFVVGIKDSDASKPTVLLYSNYTVDNPDDPAAGSWSGAPFTPIKDGDEGEGAVTAKGVAEVQRWRAKAGLEASLVGTLERRDESLRYFADKGIVHALPHADAACAPARRVEPLRSHRERKERPPSPASRLSLDGWSSTE